MKIDEYDDKHQLARHFKNIFQRLLAGEQIDFHAEGLSSLFQGIATNLFAEFSQREAIYYDGVIDVTWRIRKLQQIEFEGEIWIGRDHDQWKESFRARVTDKRLTKEGIWITLWIGERQAEGDLRTAFRIIEDCVEDDI